MGLSRRGLLDAEGRAARIGRRGGGGGRGGGAARRRRAGAPGRGLRKTAGSPGPEWGRHGNGPASPGWSGGRSGTGPGGREAGASGARQRVTEESLKTGG